MCYGAGNGAAEAQAGVTTAVAGQLLQPLAAAARARIAAAGSPVTSSHCDTLLPAAYNPPLSCQSLHISVQQTFRFAQGSLEGISEAKVLENCL